MITDLCSGIIIDIIGTDFILTDDGNKEIGLWDFKTLKKVKTLKHNYFYLTSGIYLPSTKKCFLNFSLNDLVELDIKEMRIIKANMINLVIISM